MQHPRDECNLARLRVTGPEQAMVAFRQLGPAGTNRVALAALLLDQWQQVCSAWATAGSIGDAVEWLDECVLTDPSAAGPSALVLLVNRPGGSTMPAPCDLAAWRDASRLCRSRGVALLDVLIASGHRWRSLAETCDPSAG